jgi:hypothetical protein
MTVGQTEAAMIATDSGLDEAHHIVPIPRTYVRGERDGHWYRVEGLRRRRRFHAGGATEVSGDGTADELPNLVVGHD